MPNFQHYRAFVVFALCVSGLLVASARAEEVAAIIHDRFIRPEFDKASQTAD